MSDAPGTHTLPGREAPEPAMNPENVERELERMHGSSFGWALACCRWDRQEAEEVLQASYLKALEGRARFNGHASVKTWFFGVVKRTAAEQRRTRLVRHLALGRWLLRSPAGPEVPTPESLSSRNEAQARLRRLLRRLSGRQRDLMHLVFYEGLTVEQAAEVLHVGIGTARTHYERGKARLRELLESETTGAGEGR